VKCPRAKPTKAATASNNGSNFSIKLKLHLYYKCYIFIRAKN
jgi:hypothetical protein